MGGGGLISSLEGRDEQKKMRLTGQDRIKSDQRILGDSNFVQEVLSESEEHFARKYELKSRGLLLKRLRQAKGQGAGQGFGLLLVSGRSWDFNG